MASMRPAAGLKRRFRASTLGERIAAAREQAFVGRTAERELFRAAAERRVPVSIVYLYGPGGVGKSTLLVELARIAGRSGLTCALLDGRRIHGSPSGFLEALQAVVDGKRYSGNARAVGCAAAPAPLRGVERTRPHAPPRVDGPDVRRTLTGLDYPAALMIDSYDELLPIDGWLRGEFFGRLPAETVVVIAARTPPTPAWRTDPGLGGICRLVPLRNLSPEESRQYLSWRGVPDAHHDAAVASTYGHPMALALVADVCSQQAGVASADLLRHPDLIGALVGRFLAGVPAPRYRAALEVCAHARVTTEALLQDVLGGDDIRELFEWLRTLSFVEQIEEGLLPHDLARDVIEADLRWRNPDRYRQLHRGVRQHVLRRFQESRGLLHQRVVWDKLFIHRNSPLMQPYFEWSALGSTYIEGAGPEDHAAIVAMVRRHEGADSARIAEYWLERQPTAFQVYRTTSGGPPMGFMAHLLLGPPAIDDADADPAIASIAAWLRCSGSLREGERILVHRFWMGQDRYQDTTTQSIIAAAAKLLWLNTPHLAYAFPCTADAPHWAPMFAYINFDRAPEADFLVGGRRYGVFVHDWRQEPMTAWLDALGERELDADLTVANLTRRSAPPVLVVSEADFARAVRRALRDLDDPVALAASPLARSRVVVEQAGESDRAAVLRSLLCAAVEALKGRGRDDKLYRAVWHTYVRPASTQEAAAERLGLPFSTYRYHLARGLERITASLWARELDVPPRPGADPSARPLTGS